MAYPKTDMLDAIVSIIRRLPYGYHYLEEYIK